ncbi:MAG TPA: efflux RND transporter periplasmic adaptor subunit [Verrucomicrobiae bacterium]|nr:efflux RND transporter periplasmic adaptor subunit [Verrucomicrobiae bacterium]
MKRTLRITLFVVALAVVLIGLALWHFHRAAEPASELRVFSLTKTNLLATISATGTVEPEEVVDVGAQVAGQINSFGKDDSGKPIDYDSEVDAGTVLAQIDPALYAADVEVSQANLESAQANVLQAQAKLGQAQQDWDRAQKLGPSEALAPSAYDQYKANFEVAKANLEVAKAGVAQAKAALDRAQRNLDYCTIKSPVKGVIIDRRVNIGQTVVSSLNAPSLFLIAKDLKRIEVWVSVNEADIGNIHSGQPVTFTVDAFPGQTFHGQVNKVRLNATMTQNVVTYTVVVSTDNSDGKLLPYLTANVQFITGSRQDVFAVPNAALRWTPQPNQIAPEFRQSAAATGSQKTLWVALGNLVRPVKVNTGLTDGTLTEVEGAGLADGMKVVGGEQSPSGGAMSASGEASPFTPQIGRARGNAAQPGGGKPGGAP